MRALWMSMILSSASALGPSAALAHNLCAEFFTTEYAALGRIEVEPRAVTGPKASEYADTLHRIDQVLGNLKAPAEANVVVHDSMLFSSFNPKAFTVYVGLRPGSVMGEKHQNINMVTLAHEYGHATLETNLRAQIPNFKKLSLKVLENSDETSVQAIIYTGLHEFFADALTLVTTKNPKALSELLSRSRKSKKQLEAEYLHLKKTAPPEDQPDGVEEQIPQIKKYSREAMSLRDMSNGFNHLQHQKWQEILKDEYVRMDPYFILLPARWHLWQSIETRIDSKNYQKEILGKVFQIVKKEMEYIIPDQQEKLSASDVEMLNQRIIRKLDEALL